jgi:hypothetical protein
MAAGQASIVAQIRQLLAGSLSLVQSLLKLTGSELQANAGALRGPLAALLAAAVLAGTALTLLLVAAILALAQLVGHLAATLIVATLAAVAALALARHALSRLNQVQLAPTRAIATLQMQIDRFSAKPAKDKPNDQ